MKSKVLAIVLQFVLLVAIFGKSPISVAADNPLSGKTALFVGDSIAAGWRDEAMNGSTYGSGNGWAKRIGNTNNMNVANIAVAGASLSTIRDKRIITQIKSKQNSRYDYVILQGGFNDAMGTNEQRTKASAAPVGTMSSSYELGSFDIRTYAGALEELFYWTTKYFQGARIGYIITYATPLSQYGGYTAEWESMKRYWDMGKRICEKWGIDYLDLFEGKTQDGKSYSFDILKVNTNTYFPGGSDSIHLNSAGYDVISPYIAEWMKTLKPYDSSATSVSTSSNTTLNWTTLTSVKTNTTSQTAKTISPALTTTSRPASSTTIISDRQRTQAPDRTANSTSVGSKSKINPTNSSVDSISRDANTGNTETVDGTDDKESGSKSGDGDMVKIVIAISVIFTVIAAGAIIAVVKLKRANN